VAFNIMKRQVLYTVGLIFWGVFSATGWAINNPVGSGTVPPTATRSGLIRSPNPIDRSGNLVITGHVGGGRHFRGVVPYNAVSDFGGRLGSATLDPFLRRSAVGGYFGRYAGKPTPYYSQTRTVTTTRPGESAVIRPPTTKVGRWTTDRFPLAPLRKQKLLSGSQAGLSMRGFEGLETQKDAFGFPVITRRTETRPMSMPLQELAKVISEERATYLQAKRLAEEQDRPRSKQFQRDLKQISEKAAELQKGLTSQESSSLSTTKKPGMDVPRRPETLTAKAQAGQEASQRPFAEPRPSDIPSDVYEQMKRQLYSFQEALEQPDVVQQAEEPPEGRKQPLEDQAPKSSQMTLAAAKARAIIGSYKSFASFAKDRFNQHLRAAEQYLKQGRYYRAADAYTLAVIYKPDDPLAYAGKSHALFAAGEYMSSALFLSRALEIFPEYVRFKIDIEAMVGDRDKLESRIADVEQWLKTSDAVELQFLLGYVYYQMGRLEPAKEAINAAYEKMPEAPAVIVLKEAIEIADSK
jgi:tetratricopeptide (TPR) repeat protein